MPANDPAPPAPGLQTKTQSAFVSLTLITQACHGILNTNFTAPDPKPSWFDDLQNKLDTAKTHATDWVDNLAPNVTGGVPVQVINYGTTYAALTAQIQEIVKANPDASGADNPYVKQVHDLVAALAEQVQNTITNAQGTQISLKNWGDLMQASHDALSKGAANIQAAEADLQASIDEMNNTIDSLRKAIEIENKAVMAGEIGVGVGLFLMVVGLALAPVTLGGSLVVGGIGLALLIGGAVDWGIEQKKINDQFGDIAKDQTNISTDKAQIVALQGLASASDQAVTYIAHADQSLSDFRTSWAVFQGELQGVLDKLKSAESSLSTIVEGAFTVAAANEWALATQFAQDLADVPVQVAAKNLSMSGQAA